MASKKSKAAKAGGTVMAARSSPYVQRLVNDAELRENIKTAFDSARDALDRLGNGKTPAKVIFDDKKFHKEVQHASEALRDASVALRAGSKKPKRRKRRAGRMLFLLVISAGAALALSEGLRNKLLDALFGKEEEFDYTSTTAPPPPPPAPSEPAETPSAS